MFLSPVRLPVWPPRHVYRSYRNNTATVNLYSAATGVLPLIRKGYEEVKTTISCCLEPDKFSSAAQNNQIRTTR